MSSLSSLSGLSGASSNATVAPTSSSSSSPISVNGLVSGINTTSVIQALLATEQQKITNLQTEQQTVTTAQTAFDGIEAKIQALQGTLAPLTSAQSSVFDARTATSSNTGIVNAAASGDAINGVYDLRVNSLAAANAIASQGFDATSSAITQGTLQLNIGGKATTITIDSTNDTLQGLADAINGSGAAVTANIVNDGSGDGSQGYRLVLAATQTGTSNAVSITSNLAASGGGAVQPIFNTGTISNAIPSSSFTGTSAVQANAGAGYTGTSNDTYTFTVVNGGTVGTDNGIQLSYTDATGANTGTITLNAGDVNTEQTVAQGVQVQFGAGTLNAGDSFSVKTFVPTVQAASDASVSLGSGSGALTVTSATNTINTLIPGVTLALQSASPNTQVAVTVANDNSTITSDINAFVSAYNDALSTIQQATSYDAASGQGGPLLGDWQTQAIENQLTSIVESPSSGANPLLNNLGALGISTGSTGQLTLDSTQLNNVLSGGVSGVSINDVQSLFGLTGSSTNSGITFITAGAQTQSSTTPYTLNIDQAAQQAALTSTNNIAASTVIDNTNNSFVVNINGQTSDTLTLAAGTYTQTQLAQAVATAINGDAALAGNAVNVGVNGNNLVITSSQYGSGSQVSMQSGSALASLGFNGGELAKGTDVVGNFIVNGVSEPAQGFGQFLTGDSTNANTAGLEMRVTLTPAQVGTGIQAPVSVSNGIAAQLDNFVNGLTDPVNGVFQQVDSSYQTSITQLTQQQTTENAYITAKTTQLQDKFAAMETTLSQLQSASSVISQFTQSLLNENSNSNSSSSTKVG